jgi:hypothetical protein
MAGKQKPKAKTGKKGKRKGMVLIAVRGKTILAGYVDYRKTDAKLAAKALAYAGSDATEPKRTLLTSASNSSTITRILGGPYPPPPH